MYLIYLHKFISDGKFVPRKSNTSSSEQPSVVTYENKNVEQLKEDKDQYVKTASPNNVSTEQSPYGNPQENEADSDLYYDKEDCTLQEYEIMKVCFSIHLYLRYL